MSPQLLLHLFSLLCIGSNVTQSAKRNTTNSGDLLSLLNAKPEGLPPVSENLTGSNPLGDIQASDYMVRLFLRISKSNGQVINPDAFMGDHIHGFIDNGELFALKLDLDCVVCKSVSWVYIRSKCLIWFSLYFRSLFA